MDARAAIGLTAHCMLVAYLLHQQRIGLRTLTGWAIAPGVKAARTHPIQPTHHSDRVLRLAVPDEGKDVCFRLEVNSMAFFKRSCSIFRRSYSRLTLRNSFSSAATSLSTSTPFVTIRPSRACLRQRDNMKG